MLCVMIITFSSVQVEVVFIGIIWISNLKRRNNICDIHGLNRREYHLRILFIFTILEPVITVALTSFSLSFYNSSFPVKLKVIFMKYYLQHPFVVESISAGVIWKKVREVIFHVLFGSFSYHGLCTAKQRLIQFKL